jgi:beta-lactamase regulating signal transducer with metallopeptidase domain/protocatechuate 3,4-dioxygenase beta subunit
MDLPTNEMTGLVWSQLWQVTALVAIVAVATRLVCRRRPHLAYMLWMLVVLKCVTPPLWSSPAGLFSWAQCRVERAESAPAANEAAVASTTFDDARQEPVSPPVSEQAEADDSYEVVTSSPPPAPVVSEPQVSPPCDRVSWSAIATISWIVGSAVMAGLMRWKWCICRRALRHSATAADAAIEHLTADLAGRLGLKRKVRVLVTSEPIGPAVFGFLRPVIVLPQALVAGTLRVPSASVLGIPGAPSALSSPPQPSGRHAETSACWGGSSTATPSYTRHTECAGYDAGYLEPILAHELIHLRRGDTYWGAVQLLVEVLWWFHPLVWWANRETCRQRERCCDEEVVAALKCRPAAYARCLLDVLELERNWQPMLAVTAMQSRKDTSRRLEDIMRRSNGFRAKAPRWSWALLLVAAALVLPGKALVLAKSDRSETAATQDQETPDQQKPLPSDRVSVTVLVVDTKGQPVKGAEIVGWNSGDGLECNTYRSDDNGRATIPWQKSALFGVFRIIARNEEGLGWHGSQPGPDVAEETIKRPIKITLLPRTRTADGVCVDADGRPLSGVSVRVTGLHHAANGGIIMHGFQGDSLGSAVSDGQGRYSIKLPECQVFRMTAEHPRFVVVEDSRGPNSKPGRFVLREPAGQVQGRVVDAVTGLPIRGARILAQSLTRGQPADIGLRISSSDENGRYTLVSMAPGSRNILFDRVAGKPELIAAAVEGVQVKANETAAADFRVAPGRRLSGQVIDAETNAPLARVCVGYYGSARPRSGAACLMVKTDAQGRFQFFVPPGGSFVYVAQSFEGPRQSRELIVEPDNDPAPIIFKGTLTPSPHYEAAALGSSSIVVAEGEARLESPDDLAYTARGTFRTTDGKPVPTATVVVRRFDGKKWQDFSSHRVSCHDSRFQIYLGNRFFNDKGERDYVLEERFYRNRIGKTWRLVIDVPGYARPKPVEFTFEKEIKPLVVSLERPKLVPVRGRVVDADGRPVADANVSVVLDTAGEKQRPWGPEYLTDADGRFELKHVYVGCTFAVRIDTENQSTTSATMTLKDSAAVDLGVLQLKAGKEGKALPPAAPNARPKASPRGKAAEAGQSTVVTGRVVDSAGKGIAGAQVAVTGLPDTLIILRDDDVVNRTRLLGQAKADADGRFRLTTPKFSSTTHRIVKIAAAADGFCLGAQAIGLDVEQPNITITLGKEETIRGRVVGPDGKPAANVEVFIGSVFAQPGDVFLGSDEPVSFWPKPVKTDSQGRFTLRGVDRDQRVSLALRDERFAKEGFVIAPANQRSNRVSLDSSGELVLSPAPARAATVFEGKITCGDTGKPAAGAFVAIDGLRESSGGTWLRSRATTDAAGRFRVKSPHEATVFCVTVSPADGQPYLICEQQISLTDKEQPPKIEIALPRGVLLRGKVVEKQSGRPVAGAAIVFNEYQYPRYAPERAPANHTPRTPCTVTKADGTFALGVPPGFGLLLAQGPGGDYIRHEVAPADFGVRAGGILNRHYVAAFAALDPKIDEEPDEQNLTIERGVTLRGRIVGPGDSSVGEVQIQSTHFCTFNNYHGNGLMTHGGEFELHGLDPGASEAFYFLDMKNQLGATVKISGKSAEAGPLVVRLQPCGKAVARFVNAEGSPLAKLSPLPSIVLSPNRFDIVDGQPRRAVWADHVYMIDRDEMRDSPERMTDKDGRFTFRALIPGAPYGIGVLNHSLQDYDRSFSVESGETVELGDVKVRGG